MNIFEDVHSTDCARIKRKAPVETVFFSLMKDFVADLFTFLKQIVPVELLITQRTNIGCVSHILKAVF